MRIWCQGWKRVQNDHILLDHDISGIAPSNESIYDRDHVYINVDNPTLKIKAGIENLTLNGSFYIEVVLSKEEIINLARIALANEPFGEVIDALSALSSGQKSLKQVQSGLTSGRAYGA